LSEQKNFLMPRPSKTDIELFLDDADGMEGIGLLLRNPSIIEHPENTDELVSGCKLSADDTEILIFQLQRHLDMLREDR